MFSSYKTNYLHLVFKKNLVILVPILKKNYKKLIFLISQNKSYRIKVRIKSE